MLDFATSLVAEGKVNVASRGGKPLPPDALIGPDGRLSGDPALIYGPLAVDGPRDHAQGAGAIRAFGEHKGSGLALICEIIGGSLTGNGATGPDRKFSNGMFSLYIDPGQVDPAHVFDPDMTRYIDWFRQAKAVPGEAILTPGEPERAQRAKRGRSGVPLSDEAWASIVATARSLGVNRDPVVLSFLAAFPASPARVCRFWTGRPISALARSRRRPPVPGASERSALPLGNGMVPASSPANPGRAARLRSIPGRRRGAGREDFG